MNAGGPVLRDIHLPSAAWWPPAPGWWLLAGLVLLMIVAGVWLAKRRTRQRPLRVALQEVDRLAARFAHDRDTVALVEDASRLLRRVARKVDPDAASASGEAWRAFIHACTHDAGTHATLDGLLDARFRARPTLDAEALPAALRAWCRCALRSPAIARSGWRGRHPEPASVGEWETGAKRLAGEGESP